MNGITYGRLDTVIDAYVDFYRTLPIDSRENLYGRPLDSVNMVIVGRTVMMSEYEFFLKLTTNTRINMQFENTPIENCRTLNEIIRSTYRQSSIRTMTSVKILDRYRTEGIIPITQLVLTREQKLAIIAQVHAYISALTNPVHLVANNIALEGMEVYFCGEDQAVSTPIYDGSNWTLTVLSSILYDSYFTFEECVYILPMYVDYFYSLRRRAGLHVNGCKNRDMLIPASYKHSHRVLHRYFEYRVMHPENTTLGNIMPEELSYLIVDGGFLGKIDPKDNSIYNSILYSVLTLERLIEFYSH